jgi:cellulose biosynthesis protein BcsQ
MTKKIAFVSQVGDAMKSSLAAAVGAEATLQNVATAIIDLDREHRTLTDWAEGRQDLGPGYPIVPVYSVETAVQAIKHDEGETLIVIDSPSRATAATVKIAKDADLVVQPILAGSFKHAKLAHETFTELAEKGIAPSKMVYVLTRYLSEKQCTDSREYIAMFPIKGTTIAVIDTAIPEKTGYRQAISNGYTITEASHVKQRDIAKACVSDILTLLFNG